MTVFERELVTALRNALWAMEDWDKLGKASREAVRGHARKTLTKAKETPKRGFEAGCYDPAASDLWYLYEDEEGDWGVRCDRDPVTGFPREFAPDMNHSGETKRRATAIRDALNALREPTHDKLCAKLLSPNNECSCVGGAMVRAAIAKAEGR
jgi:hypothetical protein